MELSIAVVDDNQNDIDYLVPQIKDLFLKQGISSELSCFMAGTLFLQQQKDYDLIFLDIEMPGMDGLETAEAYWKDHKSGLLIFLTSHIEYSRKGYLVRAFRFLDKSLLKEELEEAVKSATKVMGDSREITVMDLEGIRVQIEYRKILYIEVMNRKILFHTQDNIIYSKEKISKLMERLENPDFFRVHRLFVVNMKHVIRFDKRDVFMECGIVLPLSEKRIGEFRKSFIHWKYERGNG